ncbi:hypothetical protein BN1708_017192, partial [Verticillium longisporum]
PKKVKKAKKEVAPEVKLAQEVRELKKIALLKEPKKLPETRVDGEAFIVTNDAPIYFWDFTRAIWRAAGSDKGTSHVWAIPRELGLVLGFASEVVFHILGKTPTFTRQRCVFSCMTRYYNITKAKRVLGYRPIVSLDDGIKRGVR